MLINLPSASCLPHRWRGLVFTEGRAASRDGQAGALKRQRQLLNLEIEDAMANGGNICQKLKEHEERTVENQISGNDDLKTTLAHCLFSCLFDSIYFVVFIHPFLLFSHRGRDDIRLHGCSIWASDFQRENLGVSPSGTMSLVIWWMAVCALTSDLSLNNSGPRSLHLSGTILVNVPELLRGLGTEDRSDNLK